MNAHTGAPKTRSIRSLPLKEWPEADRRGWEAACRPGQRLTRGGAASHLAPVTQADLANRYGLYLDFLDRSGQLDLTAEAGALVVPDFIAGFITELQDRVSSVTVSRTIYKVRRAAECIAPSRHFAWLAEIGKDLALLERPKDKFDRVVLTERLLEAALVSFWKVDSDAEARPLARALAARNAVMVALLAACPIRLKNFAALEIGGSFRKIGNTWWIFLKDTKSRRPDHRPVPSFLTSAIERYLDEGPPCRDWFRPMDQSSPRSLELRPGRARHYRDDLQTARHSCQPASVQGRGSDNRRAACTTLTASRERFAAALRPKDHGRALQASKFTIGCTRFHEIGPRPKPVERSQILRLRAASRRFKSWTGFVQERTTGELRKVV
jgi:hypothetical protein